MNAPQKTPASVRRKTLMMLGVAVLAARSKAQAATGNGAFQRKPACVVTPEQIEGPYFLDKQLNRSDIRSDPSDGSVKPGVPLALSLRVSAIDGERCSPLRGAVVDVWHCDASGIYSGVADPTFDTTGKKFLRGYQVTDAEGIVRFLTIYPGWYPGRAVHIHFKVRAKSPKTGRNHELTSQLYFDDAINQRVHSKPPYFREGKQAQKNETDGIFRYSGRQLIANVAEEGGGFLATFDIGLRMD
ncbi:MAG TPA: intradiol ring-cleavage dioxygenase [Noviherbaspirillum sp.]|nr:intradiol ring-cleavage dioxygenase [Noviherbaspirillum sp.]